MPHTTRRKARPSSSKLVKVTTDDGWSVMSRKANTLPSQPNISVGADARLVCNISNSRADLDRLEEMLTVPQLDLLEALNKSKSKPSSHRPCHANAPLPAHSSESEVRARFDRVKASWKKSKISHPIAMMLDAQVDASALTDIKKAVCLGLGSPSNDQDKYSSMWQLVAFLETVNLLSKRANFENINMYAQDPVFNEIDRAFLNGLHINVLDSPAAFTEIDDSTFVFAPHFPISWWPSQMRLGKVPFIIGNDIGWTMISVPGKQEIRTLFQRTDPTIQDKSIPDLNVKQEFRDFQNRHSSHAFPRPKSDVYAFNDLHVYWKPPPDGGEDT